MWFISTCTRHAARRTVVVVQVQALLASKNILSPSCQVHCQQRGNRAILGRQQGRNLSARFVLIWATSAYWYGPIPTFVPMGQTAYAMSRKVQFSTPTTSNTNWPLTTRLLIHRHVSTNL